MGDAIRILCSLAVMVFAVRVNNTHLYGYYS